MPSLIIPAGGNLVKSLKSLAIASAFLLTGGIALAAAPPQHATTPPQTKVYQSQSMNNNGKQATAQGAQHCIVGTVDSATNSSVTISHKYMGQEKTSHFQVKPSTKKEGNITKGERVAVYYNNVNNQHVATMVKAEPPAG
jgi:Cu/Ag efflux protein CusF